ncbi:LysR family transcriptional regulator [Neobacillus massiliamazoniensis]|jgi:DNA-binding transcriptional LysR family regulator|uniref:LysR family transcriptional regulator n=1 Tax=Neobacillus massiliamazoniensis TaxID=1499688 RepID=A0A0U1NY76_9BACI|nr:LysR family transcriptional regulator [Neobacillus massiliamazoniensis]CRK82971.1 LysR family transcriptional regulator [Neobacillus massiliamazoniensis]
MNIEQLQYIVEVAKYSSLSKAAQNLHVTQSTISQSITGLEKELGLKILKRSRGHGAVPTDEGRMILKLSFEVLKKLEEIRETVNMINSTEVGELKISSLPGLMTLLVKAIAAFRHDFPHVNMEVAEKSGSDVIEDVHRHKSDIGLVTYSSDWNINMDGIVCEPLILGKQKVYVSKHSPLAFLGTVTPQDILDQTLVTYNGEFMKYFVQDFFNKYKPMKTLLSSNNMEGVGQAIIESLAITFAPDFVMKNYPPVVYGDIVAVDLVNHGAVNISLGLVRSENKHLSTFTNKYIHYLKSEINKS